ncbi:MAG TPA: PilT/PilU family type 4a pilus ATPase [Nitriliruptorales bacterium]|nr:PilT/PilU family type 4a pilus ATPase [Nitriliruptorales bacterium]
MPKAMGDILLERGVITTEQLGRAEQFRIERGMSLGKSLVELGLVEETDLVRALADQLGMEFVEVDATSVDPSAAEMIPRALAEEVVALPVRFGEKDELVVAVADPNNRVAKEKIEAETGLPVRLALSTRKAVVAAVAHLPAAAGGAPIRRAEPPRLSATAAQPEPPTMPLVEAEEETSVDLDELLEALVEFEGSDLHLTSGVPPSVRVHGELRPLEGYPKMTPNELRKMLYGILTQKQREAFENNLELDLSYSLPGRARFRVNVFQQRDSIGSVMRVIPFEIKPLDQLGVPPQVANFGYLPRGFVLVTGPTGSGKSTTLASVVDLVNTHRAVHIMTVEDPIEFLHRHKTAVVNQREVGTDTHGFNQALKHVLRQDPDVILVGEMRDLETIHIALTAAETGHLVFGTLHTQDAPQTVDRIIDVFPPHQQEQIRVQLAGALQGVVCQQLLKTADGKGRTVACEVMVATPAIRNLIREGKTHQIYSSIQAGQQHGMVAMDQSLASLVKMGRVSYDEALAKCSNVQEFNRLAGRT